MSKNLVDGLFVDGQKVDGQKVDGQNVEKLNHGGQKVDVYQYVYTYKHLNYYTRI